MERRSLQLRRQHAAEQSIHNHFQTSLLLMEQKRCRLNGCKRVESLLECALHMVVTIITEQAVDMFYMYMNTDYISPEERRELELHIAKTAQDFDKAIPIPLHDIVMRQCLKCLPGEFISLVGACKIKLNYLDIVFRSHATRFDVTEWSPLMWNVLYRSLPRLKKVQCLKLKLIDLGEGIAHITRAIKNMKLLHTFTCRYCCDQVIKVLCNNCPVRNLNICLSTEVTDLSLPHILSVQNLEKLNVFGCGFSKKSCFEILKGLPLLNTVSTNNLKLFLEEIEIDNVQQTFQSLECYCYSLEDMVNVTECCPLITKLYLNILQSDIDSLSALTALSQLKIFELCSIRLEFRGVKSFLESKGDQLIELRLSYFKDTSAEVVNKIKSLCPNLKIFTLNNSIHIHICNEN